METMVGNDQDWSAFLEQAIDMGIAVLAAIIILVVGFKVAGFVERKLKASFEKSEKIDDTVGAFLASLGKYTIILITLVAVLDQFGVETTSLIALIGAAGLAIGLALQGTLSNVASGVMLLIFRPFSVGQFVEVAGHSGVVKSISLFVTGLDTGDNVRILIPNSQVWGNAVKNFNFHDIRRVDLVFGISYGDSIDKAMSVINSVLEADKRVLKEPASLVAVTGLGDSSVDIVTRAWCKSGDYWAVYFHLLKAVKEAFDEEGIDIPYPTQTIHGAKELAELP